LSIQAMVMDQNLGRVGGWVMAPPMFDGDGPEEPHQHLLEAVGALSIVLGPAGAIAEEPRRQQVEQLWCELYHGLRGHFCAEESLMADSGYPRFDQHRAAHLNILAEIDYLRATLERDVEGEHWAQGFRFLAAVVHRWLISHSRSADRCLADFLAGEPVSLTHHASGM